MVVGSIEWMQPSDIRFIQESISFKFQEGGRIHDAISNIENGILSPNDFPPIKIVRKDGKFYSFDNRRLYVFRVCQYRGYVKYIPVRIVPVSRLIEDRVTTENDGITVRVRQGKTEPHYKDVWLREKDDKGNRNLPPQSETARKTSSKADAVDGVPPSFVSTKSSKTAPRSSEGGTFQNSTVYTISRAQSPSTANLPGPTSSSSIIRPTSATLNSNAKVSSHRSYIPPLTGYGSESYNDVLTRHLNNLPRRSDSSRLQLAANYGGGLDNPGFLPQEKYMGLSSNHSSEIAPPGTTPTSTAKHSSASDKRKPSVRTSGTARPNTLPSSSKPLIRQASSTTQGHKIGQATSPNGQSNISTTSQNQVSETKPSFLNRLLRIICCCCYARDRD